MIEVIISIQLLCLAAQGFLLHRTFLQRPKEEPRGSLVPFTNNPFEFLPADPERPPADRAPDEMHLDKAVPPKLPIGI